MPEVVQPFFLERAWRLSLIWLQRHLSRPRRLLLFSILVGLTAGVAAVILKILVHSIRQLLVTNHPLFFQYQIYLVFPLLGILVSTLLIRYCFAKPFMRGITGVLLAISRQSARLPRQGIISHVLTSCFTVGLGGSAGLESPIVATGSAIGSNFGKLPFFNYKERTVLLACGASAGIAAVFNAPVAGLLFSIEVLLADVAISAFIPLILASATGVLCSRIILQEKILFSFPHLQPFNYHNLLFYLMLGAICGLVSLYYARVSLKIERLFHQLGSGTEFSKVFIGGSLLGLLVFIFPPLFGEGYESIKDLSQGNIQDLFRDSLYNQLPQNEWLILALIGTIGLVKVVATSITLASGGNGGNFAPSLFVGAFTGFFFARLVNMLTAYRLPEDNFTVVGMAGILAGVMYAPLTGIFLIAEVTLGYDLIIPLMVVAAISHALVRRYDAFPMDTRDLVKKGQIHTRNRDLNILRSLSLRQLVEKDFQVLTPEASLDDIVAAITLSNRHIFPVVTDQELQGIIVLDDIKELLLHQELNQELKARHIMKWPPATVDWQDEMTVVMEKFDQTNAWYLPVLKAGRYKGFISKTSIFSAYRHFLRSLSEQ